MKKIVLTLMFTTLMIVGAFVPTYAAEKNDGLEIKFDEFKYTIYDYDIDSIYVEYSKLGITEIAKIKNKYNNEVLEVLTNSPFLLRTYSNDHVEPYIFIREAKYGRTKIRLSVIVELYSEGSFREINSIKGKNLVISSQIAPTVIEDKTIEVWSKNNKFPTIEILYGYSGTLLAKVNKNVSGEISAELLGSGFSASEEIGTTIYYRLPFERAGRISLY